ncbi:MAG: hypothetical protein ACOC6B_04260 [Thermodesulfobacteriota bacterium]
MTELQLSMLVDMEEPGKVLDEVKAVVLLMSKDFNFDPIDKVFRDIVRLFNGEYPGYQKCSTDYHDLKHTTDAFLALARLMHGVTIEGRYLTEQEVNLGLICALMHDTGYIQTLDDKDGTGAKYTRIDTRRSIGFMDKYLQDHALREEDFRYYPQILRCTGLDIRVNEIRFRSPQIELLGKLLGTADLLGQMSDRTYLEKLLFLFYEFREAKIMEYEYEVDILKKSVDFYNMIRRRLAWDLDGLNECARFHFKVCWNIDEDLYMRAIDKNMGYLKFLLEEHEKDYRQYLNRGGIVKKLTEKKGEQLKTFPAEQLPTDQ